MNILKNEPSYPFKDGDYTKPRHIMQVVMNVHMLIADAANEPLYVTNHPPHTFPTPDTFLEFDLSKEHNTFSRQILLRAKFATLKPPYKREDVTALTDMVHCTFIDDKKAVLAVAPKGIDLFSAVRKIRVYADQRRLDPCQLGCSAEENPVALSQAVKAQNLLEFEQLIAKCKG